MPPDGSGGGTRRVEQDSIEVHLRAPVRRIGGDCRCLKSEARQVLGEHAQAAFGNVDGHHRGAGARKLCRLAAGRGTKIGDAAAGHRPEQARGQRGGGVLHPPSALRIAGKLFDAAFR